MYGKLPTVIGEFPLIVDELFSYTYLPIKFPGMVSPVFEKRLHVFSKIISTVCCDFLGEYGLNNYMDSYVYVTAKNLNQHTTPFNRPGYHSDGFMTDDVSYLWSSTQPTVFNYSNYDLPLDDSLSLKAMESQSDPNNELMYPDNTLLRLDQYVIHRVGEIKTGVRAFLKICFSKDKYDLVGNSHNYELDYNWELRPRSDVRNMPQNMKVF